MSSQYTFNFECRPDYSLLRVQLQSGQTIKVEASAMATMDVNLQMKTKMKGGLGRLLGGESIFINEFTAQGGAGEITIAPNTPGDMDHVVLDNQTLFVQSSAYVASGMNVNVDSKWQGFKGFFSGEGLFLLKCSGQGDLWFNSYGGIIPIDVTDSLVVDTGHIVAFTEGLNYRVTSLGGYKSFFFSGEGLVCRFEGQGKVWIQTRKVQPLVGFLQAFRPQKS
jgi:uncharacterized protein (TIGR00266 family)